MPCPEHVTDGAVRAASCLPVHAHNFRIDGAVVAATVRTTGDAVQRVADHRLVGGAPVIPTLWRTRQRSGRPCVEFAFAASAVVEPAAVPALHQKAFWPLSQ